MGESVSVAVVMGVGPGSDQAQRGHLRADCGLDGLLRKGGEAGAAAFSPVAVDGGLQFGRAAHVEFVAFVGVEVLHVLCSEGEGSTGDG